MLSSKWRDGHVGDRVCAPKLLMRRGLNKNSIPAGTELVIDRFGAKDGSNTANDRDMTLPDGHSSSSGRPGRVLRTNGDDAGSGVGLAGVGSLAVSV